MQTLNNIPEFSVSEISRSIKIMIEDSFGYVKIRGEVSGFKQASSGHCYFSLKDEFALISAVCFKGAFSRLNFKIEDGMEIFAYGKVTTYEGRSSYQIIVEKVEIAGIGAILEMIEKRRQKLLAEGLFDQKHKKSLPFWPNIIGVITSPTGAVIEDIIHRVSERFPTNIHIYPSKVQGKDAHLEVINGIKYFNSLEKSKSPDVIIIARGGGSFEDLLPFNEEDLVRAVFASKIPIISAIGHETDTSLIDYVSDFRAPTPTAAAEIATPLLSKLKELVENLQNPLQNYCLKILALKEKDLKNLEKSLIHPQKILTQASERLDNLSKNMQFLSKNYLQNKEQNLHLIFRSIKRPERALQDCQEKIILLNSALENNLKNKFSNLENKLKMADKLLDSYHYKKVLQRGYAIVRSKSEIVSNVDKISQGQSLNIELANGNFDVVATANIKSIDQTK